MSFLWGGNAGSTSVDTQLPDYMEQNVKGLVDEAGNLMQQTYQAAPMPRVAPLTPDQLQAQEMARQQSGVAGLGMQTAMDYTQAGGGSITPGEIEAYQNPYMQSVADATAAEMARRSQIARQGMRQQGTIEGGWGGARHGIQEAEYDRNLMTATSNMYADQYKQSWNTGLQAAQADKTRNRQVGAQFGQQVADQQRLGTNDINAMLGIGQLGQQQVQKNYNVALDDWNAQKRYPAEQLSWMANLMSGAPQGSTTSTTTSPQKPGNAGTIIGGLGALANWYA